MTTTWKYDTATSGGRYSDRTSHGGNRLHWRALAVSFVAALALSGLAGEAHAQRLLQFSSMKRTAALNVPVGKSDDVRTDANFTDVTVSDPDVADVSPLTDKALSILGKKIGTTRVSVYSEGKKLVGMFDVEVTYDLSKLSEELARRFPQAKFRVSSVNGRIMLAGVVPDGMVLDQALTLARQFGPDLINSVQVASPQQVMLEVRFIEVSRTAGRDLGVQWNMFNKNSTTNIGNGTKNLPIPAPDSSSQITEAAAGVLSGGSPFGFAIARMITGGTTIDVLINALEQKGVARSLAEPNLVAMSGETASFLAGGEYPIPVSGNLGQITVDYKRYGVGLAFTPTVLSGSQINLKIEPEVSDIDPTRTVSVGQGLFVPALTVRRASTTIELRDGQSFMIGGLLQNNGHNDAQQLPWLGDVPVLGALFRSASYQKKETDLAIIVTPRLVRPTRPGDVVRTPLDNTLPVNDADLFLKGKTEVLRTEVRGGGAPVAQPYSGHIIDLPKGGAHAAL